MSRGIVYLVGAGPGDPGLLTRRGADVLGRADVVAYDRLVHPELLTLARPGAELVDVGKRPGASTEGQRAIDALIVDEARAGRMVVRLKGGDPFVFGRGGEECELLAREGIAFEVVPGVTSAVAAPAYAGIPLTHRDHASWVALATGHEDPTKDGSALDWDALARAGTAVFLMGVGNLRSIGERLEAAGRDPATPAAVVQHGTWPQQRALRSTLGRVADDVEAAGVGPPAVLVVGGVAGLPQTLDWFGSRPLAGRRVFVTRTRRQAGKLGAALRELGADPLEFPAIRIVEADPGPLDAALARLVEGRYAWVVVTSANTVDVLEERLAAARLDARVFATSRVAAVGPATAERLLGVGIRADLVPETFTAVAVAEAMPAPGDARAVLVPQAAQAPDDMARTLRERGWEPEVVEAYRAEPDPSSVDGGRRALHEGVDAVLFTSGSTVRSFLELWGAPPPTATVCCIGPVTAEAARSAGLRVDVVAEEHTVDGLVAALRQAVGA